MECGPWWSTCSGNTELINTDGVLANLSARVNASALLAVSLPMTAVPVAEAEMMPGRNLPEAS